MSTAATETTTRMYASGHGFITRVRLTDAARHNNVPDGPDDYVMLRVDNGNDAISLRLDRADERPDEFYTLDIEGHLMTGQHFEGSYDLKTGIATLDVTGP